MTILTQLALFAMKKKFTDLFIFGLLLPHLKSFALNLGKNINESQTKLLSSDKICETPGCYEAASAIVKNMDQSVEACDDFYRFACGNFIKNTVIPKGKNDYYSYDPILTKLSEQLEDAIKDELQKSDPRSFELLKSFYKSCMENDKYEEDSQNDFLKIISESGGWPILEGKSWNESSFDWIESILSLHKFGYDIKFLINFSISIDEKNSSNHIIELDQNYFPVDQTVVLNPKVFNIYRSFILKVVEVFGAKRQEIRNDVEKMIKFEVELAKISLSYQDQRNLTKTYNPMLIKQLQSTCPIVNWVEFFNRILHPYAQVDSDEKINVASPYYFESLSKLIEATDKRTLANYIMWGVAFDSIPKLSQRLRDIRKKYAATEVSSKSKFCTDYAMALSYAYDALYVRRYFDNDAKTSVSEISKNIQESFRKVIEKEVDWMDVKTKQAALKKLDSIKAYIAYPDEYQNNNVLDEYYANLTILPNSFYKSFLNIKLITAKHDYGNFRKPVNKSDWINHGTAAWPNAHYMLTENSINVDAGLLQGIYFAKDRPHYLNYGSIGWIIGHEVTHGFDDTGSKYDEDGNLADWWDLKSRKLFEERVQCLVDQYGNYTNKEFNLTIDGSISIGENIADNGGIRAAYLAYQDWELQNGQEMRLPNLNYTPQQMFWISAANNDCEKYTKVDFEKTIQSVHCPGEFRVVGSFRNMPEFAKDFNCPIGSNMNPEKKCRVW